jgi:hypothetical protein
MTKSRLAMYSVAVAILLAIFWYVSARHQTPPGQPTLADVTQQSLVQLQREFNQSSGSERVLLLLSPTCPVCLQGGSEVNAVLKRHPDSKVRIFAIWEPILPTDWNRPTTHVLQRLNDARVIQVWDKNHLIANIMQTGAEGQRPRCCRHGGVWWDVIAAYPSGAHWENSLPVPELFNGTVVRTTPELEAKLSQR